MIHSSPSVTRRALLGASVSLPVAAALAGCDGSDPEPTGDGPPDEVTYLTNFGQLGRDAYAYVALDKDYFADQNLAVTIEPGSGTNPNLQALLAGQAQFAAVDMAGAIIARNEHSGFVALAAIQQLPLAAVMAYEEAGINSAVDLEGRSVGLPPGAVTELLFPAFAELAGVDLSRVEQVPLEAPQLVPALASGQVDAIGQFVVGQPLVENAGDGRGVVVLPYSEWLDDMYGVALFTTVELAEQNPDLCIRFRDGLLAGLADGLDAPAEAGEILSSHNPEMPAAVAAREMELMAPYALPQAAGEPLGHLDEAKMVRVVSLMQGNGLAGSQAGDMADLVAFDLVPGNESS